jgi:hypothetical protein
VTKVFPLEISVNDLWTSCLHILNKDRGFSTQCGGKKWIFVGQRGGFGFPVWMGDIRKAIATTPAEGDFTDLGLRIAQVEKTTMDALASRFAIAL